MFTCQKSRAATDDVAFNECLQVLDQSPDALTTDAWHNSPLDAKIDQFLKPRLHGDMIVRWISQKNKNGTNTISVLVRAPEPQMRDDPDLFYLFFEQHARISLKDVVAANAFSFAKESSHGVNGFLFCTQGEIFKIWLWDGNDWN